MSSVQEKRPLSPHLQVYRPQITTVLSILHRITGFALSVGSLLLVAWLWAAAYNGDYYVFWQEAASHWAGKTLLVGWSFAFYYHLGNGIRHMFWDMGRGFDLQNVTRSGIAVVAFAFVMTGITWIIICNEIY